MTDILHKETKRVEFCLECITFQFFFDKYGRKIGWANSISVSQREGERERRGGESPACIALQYSMASVSLLLFVSIVGHVMMMAGSCISPCPSYIEFA